MFDSPPVPLTWHLSPHTLLYSYDDLYELTSANYPTGFAFADTTFTYDGVGNRTLVVSGASATPYVPNTLNQYSSVGAATYSYDPQGNLLSDGVWTSTYDAENRLLSSQQPAHSTQYQYDPFGRRIEKTVDGQTTRFLYDGDQLLAETDATGTLTAKYLYGPGIDEVLRMTRGTQTSYYHADGLGSIIALTDSTGTPTLLARYDIYGQPFLQIPNSKPVAPSGTAFGFTGREYDQETGLYHYRARTYNALIGRFHQRDPLTRGPNDFRMFGALNADNALQGWLATTPRLEDLQRSSLSLTNFIQQRLLTVGGSVPVLRLPYLYVGSVGKPLPYFKPVNETNPYLYTGNNPVNRIDPLGLWYIDINVSWGSGFGGGVTGGVLIGPGGVYLYWGGGLVGPPGFGGAITWSPQDPAPGWNVGLQYEGILAYQGGYSFGPGEEFGEIGIGGSFPTIIGVGLTGFYVYDPWPWLGGNGPGGACGGNKKK